MISHSLISVLFALIQLLNNPSALPLAQRTITESVTVTDTMESMNNGQNVDQAMPGMGQDSMMNATVMTDTVSGNLVTLVNKLNQVVNSMDQMMRNMNQLSPAMQGSAINASAMPTMTNSVMVGSPMNGMSGNMSTDMMTTMNNMNEMMTMCMADMMKSSKKWYWIGGGALALILLGLLGWWLWRNRARFIPSDPPLLILQRRLAQGEIDPAQYETLKSQLS